MVRSVFETEFRNRPQAGGRGGVFPCLGLFLEFPPTVLVVSRKLHCQDKTGVSLSACCCVFWTPLVFLAIASFCSGLIGACRSCDGGCAPAQSGAQTASSRLVFARHTRLAMTLVVMDSVSLLHLCVVYGLRIAHPGWDVAVAPLAFRLGFLLPGTTAPGEIREHVVPGAAWKSLKLNHEPTDFSTAQADDIMREAMRKFAFGKLLKLAVYLVSMGGRGHFVHLRNVLKKQKRHESIVHGMWDATPAFCATFSSCHRALRNRRGPGRKRLLNARVRRVRKVLRNKSGRGDGDKNQLLLKLAQAMGPFLARNLVSLLRRNNACASVVPARGNKKALLELTGPGARKGMFLVQMVVPGLGFVSPSLGLTSADPGHATFFSNWMHKIKVSLAQKCRQWQNDHPEFCAPLRAFAEYFAEDPEFVLCEMNKLASAIRTRAESGAWSHVRRRVSANDGELEGELSEASEEEPSPGASADSADENA